MTSSPYAVAKKSSIDNKGVFAKTDIPKGTRVIEYIGKKVTKKQSEIIADEQYEKGQKFKSVGHVYLFDLNKKYDLDGNIPTNTAKYINHSCEPNCEPQIIAGHIWIIAKKNIKKGEELTYDYGFDYDHYKEHKCRCGSKKCIGYIVAKKHHKKVLRDLGKL